MTCQPPRWWRRAAASGVVALTVTAPLPGIPAGAATGVASSQTVGEAVAVALATAAGPHAMADDSSLTQCMAGADPEPVAYRTDRIVLRSPGTPGQVAAAVQSALAAVGAGAAQVTDAERIELPTPPAGPPITPVTIVSFDDAGEPVPVVRLARWLRQEGEAASPDYLLSVSSGPTAMWPGDPPMPADVPPDPRAGGLGSGVEIVVYDTGLAPPSDSVHPPNVTRLALADVEQVDVREPFGEVDIYHAGHQVSIASDIATVAPGAAVVAVRITGPDGVATDATAGRRMAATLRAAHDQQAWPPLLVAAFGSAACDGGPADPGGELPPLGLQAVAEAVDRHQQALLVASAGNRSMSRPFYPAAFPFPSTVAVGALDTTGDADGNAWTAPSRTGPPADFSNYGPWVDAWAPGLDLTTLHLKGYRFEPDGPVIDGLARVTGTSYAGPYLAGLIAEQMSTSGLDAATAWQQIAGSAVPCSLVVGGGVAVALPSLDAGATAPPAPNEPPQC